MSLFSVTTSFILLLLITTSLRKGATASCIAILIDTTTSLTSISINTDWVVSPEFVVQVILFVNARCH